MTINELIKVVHDNAVEHGWWDDPRDPEEVFALIHSEFSEALEEARAGRGEHWYGEHDKPEGFSVELIDAVIRIFDFLGSIGWTVQEGLTLADCVDVEYCSGLMESPGAFINFLHNTFSDVSWTYGAWVMDMRPREKDYCTEIFLHIVGAIVCWVQHHGNNAEELLLEKHAFNKQRPYKHGKKF